MHAKLIVTNPEAVVAEAVEFPRGTVVEPAKRMRAIAPETL